MPHLHLCHEDQEKIHSVCTQGGITWANSLTMHCQRSTKQKQESNLRGYSWNKAKEVGSKNVKPIIPKTNVILTYKSASLVLHNQEKKNHKFSTIKKPYLVLLDNIPSGWKQQDKVQSSTSRSIPSLTQTCLRKTRQMHNTTTDMLRSLSSRGKHCRCQARASPAADPTPNTEQCPLNLSGEDSVEKWEAERGRKE